jgi:transcriptional regulator with XRE-family HTH domain
VLSITWEVMDCHLAIVYVVHMSASAAGPLLRQWRTRRRFSQLDLAVRAEVSMKHLSYVENGRSRPSPEMIVHLAHHLDIPLREQNEILLAAGHAPRYSSSVHDQGADAGVRDAIDQIISAHTLPAVVVNASWDLVAASPAAGIFLAGVSPQLLAPPANVVRLSLHADGLRSRVVNFAEYACHLLQRIERVADRYDPGGRLAQLLHEFADLRVPSSSSTHHKLLLPLEVETREGIVRMFSTIATFGSPLDVTIDELAIETFYPSDSDSADRLARLTTAG